MRDRSLDKKHLMTVLVEDYFHVGAFEKLIRQRNWPNFEPRYEQNTIKALDLLDRHDAKATFFVLGWIAEQNPGLIREIVSRGHEVASRGMFHRPIQNLTPDELRQDIKSSVNAIENAGGQKVVGYRAAEKLSYTTDRHVLDILADEGLAYDASFVPSIKDEKAKRFAHKLNAEGKIIWEFPYSTRNLGLGLLPISGGNYLRQIPYTLMRHAVSDWHRRYAEPFIFYFHVWELDPEQPRISAASGYNRIRHYRKLDKMEWIIKENLELYNFADIADFLGMKDGLRLEASTSLSENAVEVAATNNAAQDLEPLTVVIPCYNEQDALPYLANSLKSLSEHFEKNGYDASFLFVDDQSTDASPKMLHELFGKDEKVSIVNHERNLGVAAAIMTGIKNAKTEIVCSMDCDCTYDPLELAGLVPLLTDGVDMVTASPYHKNGGVNNVPGWRLFLSRGASFLYRRVLKVKLNTYTSCFRVYRRSSLNNIDIKHSGFLGVAEMLGRVDLAGGRIIEQPAVLDVRLFGFSKMKTARTIFGHLGLLSELAVSRLVGKNRSIKTDKEQEQLNVAPQNNIREK